MPRIPPTRCPRCSSEPATLIAIDDGDDWIASLQGYGDSLFSVQAVSVSGEGSHPWFTTYEAACRWYDLVRVQLCTL